MLNVINRYTHGFVSIPVILACSQRGLFDLLAQQGAMQPSSLIEHLGANSGHFSAALRLLQSFNWLSQDSDGRYQLTEKAE